MVIFCQMTTKIGALIRRRLEERNMSQTDLADKVGMTSSQISRIISGERGTTIENLIAIADCLIIDRDMILRAAANLPSENGLDPWAEEMDYKISQIKNPARRRMAERLIDGLLEDEETEQVPKRKPKTKPATS